MSRVVYANVISSLLHLRYCASDASPVWYCNEYDGETKQCFLSVLDWLTSIADEDEHSNSNGDYERFPIGTRR